METVLVKKPSNGEGLDLVDSECFYSENQSGECTAPIGLRCPYRRFKTVVEAPHGGRTLVRVSSNSKPARLVPSPK
jgi:hypothetical protein